MKPSHCGVVGPLLSALAFPIFAQSGIQGQKEAKPTTSENRSTQSQGGAKRDSLAEEIIALEKQSWVAWKNKDKAAVAGFFAEDYRDVGELGVWENAKSLRMLDELPAADYSLDNFEAKRLDKNVVLMTYRAKR